MHIMNGQIVSMSAIAKALGQPADVVRAWNRQDPRPAEMDSIYINVPEVREPLLPFQIHNGATLDVSGAEPVAYYSAVDVDLETARADALQRAAVERYAREVGGTTLPDNTPLATDRDTQGKLIAVRIKALEDNAYTVNWKGETGFVTLDAPKIIFIADTIQTHVQAQFDWEMAQTALIETATTVEELRDIVTAWGSDL